MATCVCISSPYRPAAIGAARVHFSSANSARRWDNSGIVAGNLERHRHPWHIKALRRGRKQE